MATIIRMQHNLPAMNRVDQTLQLPLHLTLTQRTLLAMIRADESLELPLHLTLMCCLLRPGPLQRNGLELGQKLSLFGQLTAGLSAGQLLDFVQQLAAAQRAEQAATAAVCKHASSREGAAMSEHAVEGSTAPAPVHAESALQEDGDLHADVQQAQPWVGQAPLAQQGLQAGVQQVQLRQLQGAASLEELALRLLPGFVPYSRNDAAALREWTARVHQPLPPEVRRRSGGVRGRGARSGWESGGVKRGLSWQRLCVGGEVKGEDEPMMTSPGHDLALCAPVSTR